MWLALLACIISYVGAAPGETAWQRRDRLGDETLASAAHWFAKKDPSLGHFLLLDKLPIDRTYSALLVHAQPASGESPHRRAHVGLFVVYGQTNQVYMVLDIFPVAETKSLPPTVAEAAPHKIRLDFIADYGFYQGSFLYAYDLVERRPAKRHIYSRGMFAEVRREGGRLEFSGSFDPAAPSLEELKPRRAIVTVGEEGQPSLRMLDEEIRYLLPPGPSQFPEDLLAANPLPVPEPELHRRLRGDIRVTCETPWPGAENMSAKPGPVARDGNTIWFATSFYDGEGATGVGAVGSFHIPSRQYKLRYLPETAAWSGSAILLDGEDLWIGLMRQPEGAPYGGGLLRYNRRTGETRRYDVPDLIYTISRSNGALWMGTNHGIYTLRDGRLIALQLEPGPAGRTVFVTRAVP